LPKEVCMRINEELVKVKGSWTNKKVRDYWYYHVKRKSKNAGES
jgi:hypothetical protein